MPRLQHILCPYDFSAPADRIVPFVRALAVRTGGHVTLLSVIPPFLDSTSGLMIQTQVLPGDDPLQATRNVQRRLDQALVRELAGVRVDRMVDGGDPALRIVDFAHSHGVDLIMMPTHGVGPFRRLLLGSVTAKVLHDARCPVWTAAHAETTACDRLPRSIVCAIDSAAIAAGLATWAAEFGRLLGARLTFVHVVGPVTDWPSSESERHLQEHVREEARQRIAAALVSSGIDAPLRVAVGHVSETVIEQALQEQAELLIAGRGSAGEPFGRLRSHTFGLIQRSRCPVVSV